MLYYIFFQETSQRRFDYGAQTYENYLSSEIENVQVIFV